MLLESEPIPRVLMAAPVLLLAAAGVASGYMECLRRGREVRPESYLQLQGMSQV